MHSSRVMSYRRYTNGDQSYWCTFTLFTPPMQRTFHSNYFSISYELFRIVSEKVPQHCPYEKDFCLMLNGKVEQGQWIISWYDEHCIPNQTSKIWINEKIKVYSLRMIFVLLSFQRWVLRRKFVPSVHFSCRINAEILNVRKFASMSIIVSPYLTCNLKNIINQAAILQELLRETIPHLRESKSDQTNFPRFSSSSW